MGQEIERKFLLNHDGWRMGAARAHYRQGYLSLDAERTVRIRTVVQEAGGEGQGYLTIKGKTVGAGRSEYEYEIPIGDAQELVDKLCLRPLIEKFRYKVPQGELTWEIDEFLGENAGLVVAEIELEEAEQTFDRPDWVGEEVTHDTRYSNASLVKYPYSRW
jgi:adenylate cyclase